MKKGKRFPIRENPLRQPSLPPTRPSLNELDMAQDATVSVDYEHDKLITDVRRSVRYHMRRRRFHEWRNHATNAVSTVSGSAIIAVLWAAYTLQNPQPIILSIVIAGLVTTISVLDLISSTATMARLHSDLARRFIQLEQQLMVMEGPTESDIKKAQSERLEIELDEPPIYRVVDLICHNEVILAYGRDKGHIVQIPRRMRITANFINWDTEKLKSANEIANEKRATGGK